jgi:hypothetical protein
MNIIGFPLGVFVSSLVLMIHLTNDSADSSHHSSPRFRDPSLVKVG